ncbi:MAG: AgmX/PglI C-terminal domain-containing protein [Sandaracinaceae bacterium]
MPDESMSDEPKPEEAASEPLRKEGWGPPPGDSVPPGDSAPPGPSSAVAGIAAAVPLLALFVGCGLTGVAFAGQPGAMEEMGLVGVIPLILFVLCGLVLVPMFFFLGRGRAIPTFIVLGLASLPWLAGLLGGWLSVMGLGQLMAHADPSTRATLMAQAVSETMLSGVTGSIAGGTLLIASAFGLGLAAIGQRAPRRALWAGILGFGATLPLAAVAAYALVAREYFVVVPVLGALLVALSLGLGLAGAGADERGRSGALASAVPWIGGLGVAALISASAHKSTIMIFYVVANASSDMRVALMAHGAEELSPMVAARWLVPLAVFLAGVAAAGWAATRKRPGTMQLVAGGVLVLGFLSVLGFGAGTRMLIARGAASPAVLAPSGFEAASMDTWLGDSRQPDVFVGETELRAADGSGTSGSLTEMFSQHRGAVEPGSDWFDAEPELVLSFDERAPAEVLQGLTAAAREAGVRSFAITVTRPVTQAEKEVLETVPTLWVAAAAFQGARCLSVAVASDADLEQAHDDLLFLHTTLGDSAPTSLEARPGVGMEDRALDADLGSYDVFENDDETRTPVWVVLGPQTTVESLLTLIARLHANGHVPVLVETLPDATRPEAARLPVGTLGAADSGVSDLLAALRGASVRDRVGSARPTARAPRQDREASPRASVPRVRFEDTTVRGSLSSSVIRQVMRRNLTAVRACYESHRRRVPGAEGRVDLHFVIDRSGRVSSAVGRSAAIPDVGSCVAQAVRRWVFPAPAGGGVVVVDQPIRFEAG